MLEVKPPHGGACGRHGSVWSAWQRQNGLYPAEIRGGRGKEIMFFDCERWWQKPDELSASWRLASIAEEAAKQTGRGIIPQVIPAGKPADMLERGGKKI